MQYSEFVNARLKPTLFYYSTPYPPAISTFPEDLAIIVPYESINYDYFKYY